MHPFFAPLDAFDLGTLITALTAAGRAGTECFAHLPPARRQAMQDKAQQLLAIPTEKRVTLLVRELKEQLQEGGARGIERMDPSWLAWSMQREQPRVVAVLLAGLPPTQVRSVLRRLPAELVTALPPKAQVEEVPARLRRQLRQLFEVGFTPMPPPPTVPWKVTDCVHLERRQLTMLVRDLGLIELGQAFASVGRMALLDLCRRLPRAAAEELVMAVRLASPSHVPDPKEAQRFLSRVVVNFENTEEFMQKAGLWRLARALMGEPEGAVTALMQRLPRRAALLVQDFQVKASELAPLADDARARLQDSVLTRVALLFGGPPHPANFTTVGLAYHDAPAAEAALAEARQGMPRAPAVAVDAPDTPELPPKPPSNQGNGPTS